jgi:FMN reductase
LSAGAYRGPAGGGRSSYMSVMSLANNLMFVFRCVINPRFVYADGSSFNDGVLIDKEIEERIEKLAASTIKLAGLNESAFQNMATPKR